MKKNLLKIIVLSLALVITQVSFAQKSYSYSSSKGNCSLTFPDKYTEKETQGESGLTSTSVQSILDNGDIYLFSFVIHKDNIKKDEELKYAELSLNSFTKSLGGEIKSAKDFKYKSHKGKEAVMTMENNYTVYYRVLLVDNMQYQFVYMTTTANEKNAKKYFKSFKMK